MKKCLIGVLCLVAVCIAAVAQDYRWQQRVEYIMNVKLDVKSHLVTGTQKLVYHNNSPDTLTKVYYHLYFNAFQPGSMMDVRSRNLPDPDPRVKDRIYNLSDAEIGYQHIGSLKQDSKDVTFTIQGTVMEVKLAKPILPNAKTTFDMQFESQVPIQIRRSGHDNKEGIAYSMTQWYPKLSEYDFRGWHAYQYVAREFQGVWGDFDVTLTLDPTYIVCGTGKLENGDKVGYGYEKSGTMVKRPVGNLVWHFIAKNVIDFAWAADPQYVHDKASVPNGPELHFFYQPGEKTTENWKKMQDFAVKHFQFMNTTFGKYPYDTYSIIQGGDGGMEYPMCTLILGEKTLGGLVGVTSHEAAHSWYQGVLASNESLYPWLDEGYADFASQESMALMFNKPVSDSHVGSYDSYFALVKRGLQEPMSQHSDHYNTNTAYGTAAYSMGTVFLQQLKYIIGEDIFYKGMRRYYNAWKFHHPEPNDFVRIMEKTSGMELKWYYSYWINTTKKIDYGIRNVIAQDGSTFITLERIGDFPMPIDLQLTLKDGSKRNIYIPLNETNGGKEPDDRSLQRTDLDAWPWVSPTYVVQIDKQVSEIASIEIDASLRMADVDRNNNKLDLSKELKPYKHVTR
ncbi:MAG: M1 family metallopeptidase [Chryseolinea sp.]